MASHSPTTPPRRPWLRGLGWAPKIALEEGIAATYRWYVEHAHSPELRVGGNGMI